MGNDGPRGSAAYRNLSIYLVGQALSNIGSFSQVVALSLLVLELSDSATIWEKLPMFESACPTR